MVNIIAELIVAMAKLISFAIWVYTYIIIARAIISWVQPNPYNPIVQALYRLTEPILGPIRRVLLKSIPSMGFDFSPIVAIILLQILRTILMRILLS